MARAAASTAGWEKSRPTTDAEARPAHRVEPEVALEVGQAQAGHVAGEALLERLDRLAPGLEPSTS
ncbi:MAG: hypothetical protein R2711_18295 [Acidimicrobiales bacterium]